VKVGVLALQGAFVEHQARLETLGVEAIQVRLPKDLDGLDALILPGGESTTFGKLADAFGLTEPLRRFANTKPMWGTCAGLVYMARDVGCDQSVLGVLDVKVARNAFGRQVDSFEASIVIAGVEGGPFPGVFIRAPVVIDTGEGVSVLSRLDDGRIVAVRQGDLIATAFHPELTDDNRLHEYFIDIIRNKAGEEKSAP
jgi:5'-phosphate synthase pdxT subunit